MKDIIWKWIKQNWCVACCLIFSGLLLAISGSFAAYTSFNSVKRVVSTERSGDAIFGSNYLSLVDLNETTYSNRSISPAVVKNENGDVICYRFTVKVCNYVWGNRAAYNPKKITYTFTAQLVSMDDNSSLPDGIIDIKVNDKAFQSDGSYQFSGETLQGGGPNENDYVFYIPKELQNEVKLQIVAEPDNASKAIVNNQKLAGVIIFASLKPTEDWKGKFLDDLTKGSAAYDGFNYEISGNGEGTVTLTWPDYLQISPWFAEEVESAVSGNSITFTVGGEITNPGGETMPRPSAYQLQFYRVPGKILPNNLNTMSEAVTVTFEKP